MRPLAFATGFVSVLVCSAALAQGEAQPPSQAAAPAPSAPAAPLPDVVMMKSGAMIRGTIGEMDPAGDVVIQTMSGEQRRISMSEVSYAGPSANMPAPDSAAEPKKKPKKEKASEAGAEKPVIRVKAGEANVKLVARQPDVTFHLKTGAANWSGTGSGWGRGGPSSVSVAGSTQSYSVVCTVPCEAVLPTGTHRLALSQGGDGPVEVDDSVTLRGSAKLEGDYTSNRGVRTAGWIVIVGSAVGGLALILTDDSESGEVGTQATLGLVTVIVGGLVGAIMTMVGDSADVQVVPEKRGSKRVRRTRSAVRLTASGLQF